MLTDTVNSKNTQLYGLSFADVEWTGGLLKESFDICAAVTVPHLQRMFESPDISHVLENFRIAAGEAEGEFKGTAFGDGDFYKWMEAAICTAVRTKNEALLDQLDEYVELIGKAQKEDGYLSTKQIIKERSGETSRMCDINEFEIYNFGHLFTSACLYFRLTGKDSFLKIAVKAAGYLKKLYAAAEKSGDIRTAVCPSHYMGLAELYRTTKDTQWLSLLKQAVRLRDQVKEGMDDNQDRIPLRRHTKIIGHAVRTNYLYAGVADLCLEEADEELTAVLHSVWKSLTTQKMYITGGCGSLYNGASPYGLFSRHQLVHQAYGYEYQLPNVTAYNETCAGVGGVMWAWRMLCLEKDAKYADTLERMLYNTNLAAVSLDGKRFFYENMLRRAKDLPYELIWGQERKEYISSYCCPPNLARLIAQSSEYIYAVDETGVYTVLYGDSRARVILPGGNRESVFVIQKTEYPYDGRIRFCFEALSEESAGGAFTLYLRIPAWVRSGSLRVENCVDGNVILERMFERGDGGEYFPVEIEDLNNTQVCLNLNMETRLTQAHALVEEDLNQVAVERGPLVYCLEGMDVDVDTLNEVLIPSDIHFQLEMREIAGREILTLDGTFLKRKIPREEADLLYRDYVCGGYEAVKGFMIPYFAWDNRGKDEMKVWLPVTEARFSFSGADQ